MWLSKMRINNVRNINDAIIFPERHLNFFLGKNATGKSTILESIYILGHGSSFRTGHLKEAIGSGRSILSVNGFVNTDNQLTNKISVSVTRKATNIAINGSQAGSRGELLEYFPVQFISPLSYQLIEGPPIYRRQFIDWGVVHLEYLFLEEWKRFKRSLIQRNATLRSGNGTQVSVWNLELAKYGTIVAERRKRYLDLLGPHIQCIAEKLLPSIKITLQYFPGWGSENELLNALEKDFAKDRKFGYTCSGPQRGDFSVKIDGKHCRSYLSRGQIKLLVLSLKLAQINLQIERKKKFGSFLIDDLCAELDRKNIDILKGILAETEFQCFITALDRGTLGTLCGISSPMFHVEHGRINLI